MLPSSVFAIWKQLNGILPLPARWLEHHLEVTLQVQMAAEEANLQTSINSKVAFLIRLSFDPVPNTPLFHGCIMVMHKDLIKVGFL